MNVKKIWTRDFTFLMVALLFVSCANYCFASSISVYAGLLGQSSSMAGLLTASFYFGSVGMRFVNGLMVQKYGAYKMMLLGAGICLGACALHLSAGIPLLILARILHGTGYSVFSTAGGTAASCLVPQDRLGEGMGYFTIGNVLAMALGPFCALSVVSGRTMHEYHMLFILSALICGIAFFLAKFLHAESCDSFLHDSVRKKRKSFHLPKTFLGFEKGVVYPSLISFLMTFAYSPVIVYLIGYGAMRGWCNVGPAFTFYACGLLGSRLFTGRLGDRHGPDCIMFPAYFCGAGSLFWMASATSFPQLCGAMFLLGLCVGAYNPQINVFCISRCTRARRGTVTAAFNGACDLGLACGSLAGGLLIGCFGYAVTLTAGAFLCLGIGMIYLVTLSRFAHGKQRSGLKTSNAR